MRLNRRFLLVPGIAAIIAAIALAGASFSGFAPVSAGSSPDPTAEFSPTVDPCQEAVGATNGDLVAAGNQEECVTPTVGKAKTHTPTPEGPTETTVPVTNTPVPPSAVPATNTPTGGSQAGGIQPPSTGTGPGSVDGQPWLLIVAGAALGLFGVGAIAAGVKRR